MTDSEALAWLTKTVPGDVALATMAQSGAALAAIVAAVLTSRLVSLHGARASALRHLATATTALAACDDEVSRLQERLDEIAVRSVLTDTDLAAELSHGPDLDTAIELVGDAAGIGESRARKCAAWIQMALSDAASFRYRVDAIVRADFDQRFPSWEETRSIGDAATTDSASPVRVQASVYEAMLDEFEAIHETQLAELRDAFNESRPGVPGGFGQRYRDHVLSYNPARIKELESGRHDLQDQVELAQTIAEDSTAVGDAKLAVKVFIAMAATMIGAPLSVLIAYGQHVPRLSLATAALLFTLGLYVLGRYLWRYLEFIGTQDATAALPSSLWKLVWRSRRPASPAGHK